MAIDDYLDPEVGVAVVVSAVVFSPPVRRVVRRGAVYGLAGIMMAGDALAALAGGIGRGVQQVAPATATAAVGAGGARAETTPPSAAAHPSEAPGQMEAQPSAEAAKPKAKSGTKGTGEGGTDD